MRWSGLAIQIVVAVAAAALSARAAFGQPSSRTDSNSCVVCHTSQQDARLSRPAALFSPQDVHRERGFMCADCHGGDAAATDKTHAHDPSHGFKGAPRGLAVITTCARCHSDAAFMRQFAPRQRVDQQAEYATSVHGKLLATGDPNVATCVSCHGAHGIRRVNDAKSPVFPLNVATTCAACHASAEHMQAYRLSGGSPLPTNQLADYQKSVHYRALTKGNDLSAPTCNDCHGNHGAAPPGVGAVVNVCGTCHAVFAAKFDTSVHRQIFDKGCVECHSNHAVLQPSDEMLGSSGHAICATCHSGADDKGAAAADHMRGSIERMKTVVDRSGGLIARVRNAGIEVSAQELALGEARSRLTLARTEIHAANPTAVDSVIDQGMTIVKRIDQAGQRGEAELRYRRRGLAVSLGAILLVVVALALKLRQIDRRRVERSSAAQP